MVIIKDFGDALSGEEGTKHQLMWVQKRLRMEEIKKQIQTSSFKEFFYKGEKTLTKESKEMANFLKHDLT